MGKIFNLDSPLMRALSKMADLLWLNILTMVCSIPIITAGAAFTALHYSCLKLVRDEECYITKDFFKSFKLNFKQSTIIWIFALLLGGVLGFDVWYLLFLQQSPNTFIMAGIIVAIILYLFTMAFVFPIQSHFYNPIKQTIKNAFLMSITVFPKTILIIVMWAVPLVIAYFVDALVMLCLLFCYSGPAFVAALLYNKTFKRYEPEKEDTNDDFSWSVNSDLVEETDIESEDSPAIEQKADENADENAAEDKITVD